MATTDEPRAYAPSIDSGLRQRRTADVPEDVEEYYMEHLNDPNYDLTTRPPSFVSAELGKEKYKKTPYDHSEVDAESHFESDRYSDHAESRHSTVEFDDESPYPEVRAAVASTDDINMPVNTIRMWFLGILFVLLTCGLNMVFSLRYPSVFITGIVAQLVALPFGRGLAYILPETRYKTFGYVWTLNPGPFSIKEHVCITVMANLVISGAYSTDVILVQRVFYNTPTPMSYQVLLALGSEIIGFSLGGFLRPFVVWPASMIWPGALVNSALFHTLHKNYGKRDRGHMSRERFFVIAMLASFVWYWFPGYIFTGLSMFSWVCWIAPRNTTINALFGTATGLGMSVLTFDWTMISFISSPLVTPWWSQMNTGVAFVLVFWIITPILYFTNVWNSAYFPISARIAWDNTGMPYDSSAIITDGVFDLAKYQAYSPVFMSITLAMAYGISFASFPAIFVHTFLWFRKDIARRFRRTLEDEKDIHSRLMQRYQEVPVWWYGLLGLVSFAFLCIAVEIFPTRLPIWGVVIAVALGGLAAVPLAMLQAITNQQVPIQVIMQLVCGYILPGRPFANMIFKTIGAVTSTRAVTFAGDLKLGHYMKVPPRVMFTVQVVAVVISCIWATVIQNWMLTHIEDICTPGQKQGFSCPATTTFATASLLWGGIGPSRLFSSGSPYSVLFWMFLVGALSPIPFYLLARRYPLSFWRYVNIPVFFAGLAAMPPASGINYISWVLTGFIFNYCIRRWRFRWWMRNNYILSAALDAGAVLGMVGVFIAFGIAKGGIEFEWWGNTVWIDTADAMGIAHKPLPESGIIGPTSWS